ncbi:MAG: hypothetical protein KBA75_02875 [Alphaproteobacteria bacterium]|nr:hypothetical protein [Alphaproteobacteria bacterium]
MMRCSKLVLLAATLLLMAYQTPAKAQDNVVTGAALQKLIADAFNPEKTTAELAALALREAGNDYVAQNIQGSAYTRLAQRADQTAEAKQLMAQRSAFDEAFTNARTKHNKWLAERIAHLLLKLDPPEEKVAAYHLALLENISASEFSFFGDYRPRQKAREQQIAQMLEPLAGHPKSAELIVENLADRIEKNFRYAPGAVNAVLAILQPYVPHVSEQTFDKLAATRTRWAQSIPDEAKQRFQNTEDAANNRAHSITVWDYARGEDVRATLQKFDQVLCTHPLLAGGKQDMVIISHGNGINQSGPATIIACPAL